MYHPDVGKNTEEQFKLINEAYLNLSNKNYKQNVDETT